jgi:hypothetical protein
MMRRLGIEPNLRLAARFGGQLAKRLQSSGRPQDESGQVVVIVGVMMMLLLLCAAVVINVGNWYDTDSHLQKAADLAAVAGAQYYETSNGADITNPSYPCTAANLNAASQPNTAAGCAQYVAGLNGILPSSETAIATGPFQLPDGNFGVKVETQHPNQSGIFMNSTRAESATAEVGGISGATNTFPATFQQDLWVVGQKIHFAFATATQPGAFNLLDACGPGVLGANQLATCFECSTTYSYDPVSDTLTPIANNDPNCTNTTNQCAAGNEAGSDPGNKISSNQVTNAINNYLGGKVVLIPVYDTVGNGGGANGTYHIAGFAALLLDDKPNAATTSKASPPVTTINGTFIKALGPQGAGNCGGGAGNFGVQTVYLVG